MRRNPCCRHDLRTGRLPHRPSGVRDSYLRNTAESNTAGYRRPRHIPRYVVPQSNYCVPPQCNWRSTDCRPCFQSNWRISHRRLATVLASKPSVMRCIHAAQVVLLHCVVNEQCRALDRDVEPIDGECTSVTAYVVDPVMPVDRRRTPHRAVTPRESTHTWSQRRRRGCTSRPCWQVRLPAGDRRQRPGDGACGWDHGFWTGQR